MRRSAVLTALVVAVTALGCFAIEKADELDNELEIELDRVSEQDKTPDESNCHSVCTQTYPEHTYPDAGNHQACVRGCRLIQIEALLSWPEKPCKENCLDICSAAYCNSTDKHYACRVGCGAPTVSTQVMEGEEEGDGSDTWSFIISPFSLWGDDEMSELLRQAETLGQMLSPGTGAQITVVEEDDNGNIAVLSFQGYSVEGAALVFTDEDADTNSLNDLYDTSTDYYSNEYGCPWKWVKRSTVGRVLMSASFVLIVFTIVACFCSLLGSGKDKEERRNEKSRLRQLTIQQNHEPVKVPFILAPPLEKQPLLVPFTVGGGLKVEGMMSVV